MLVRELVGVGAIRYGSGALVFSLQLAHCEVPVLCFPVPHVGLGQRLLLLVEHDTVC